MEYISSKRETFFFKKEVLLEAESMYHEFGGEHVNQIFQHKGELYIIYDYALIYKANRIIDCVLFYTKKKEGFKMLEVSLLYQDNDTYHFKVNSPVFKNEKKDPSGVLAKEQAAAFGNKILKYVFVFDNYSYIIEDFTVMEGLKGCWLIIFAKELK